MNPPPKQPYETPTVTLMGSLNELPEGHPYKAPMADSVESNLTPAYARNPLWETIEDYQAEANKAVLFVAVVIVLFAALCWGLAAGVVAIWHWMATLH